VNHYHLLMQTPQANLSRTMRHLDGLYTQRYNRTHKRDGPLFRGRYKAIVVDAEEYFLQVTRYIHRNPVEAGKVQNPMVYEWSSCRYYRKRKKKPMWLDVEQLLRRFPKRDPYKAFENYMKSEIDEPIKTFYSGSRWNPILGSKEFLESIRKKIKGFEKKTKEIPEARTYIQPTLETCLRAVTRVYGVREAEIKRVRRGQRNEARAMGIFVCRRIGGMKLEEIAKEFGMDGYSGVSSVIGRMGREMEKDRRTAKRFEEIRIKIQR